MNGRSPHRMGRAGDVSAREPSSRPRIEIGPPPELPEEDATAGAALTVLPMLGGLGSLLVLSTAAGGSAARAGVAAAVMLTVTLAVAGAQTDRHRRRARRTLDRVRARYRHHLDAVREQAHAAARAQIAEAVRRHPPPELLPQLLGRPPSSDAPSDLTVRIGLGVVPLAVTWDAAPEPPDRVDPVCAVARRRLLAVHARLEGMPVTLDLRTTRLLRVDGPDDEARSWLRAVVCSAAVAHRADDLAIEIVASPERLPDWEWVKWLPHDGAAGRHRLVIVDGAPAPGPAPATTVLTIGHPTERSPDPDPARLVLTPTHDRCGPATAEAIARRLAGRSTPRGAPAELRPLVASARATASDRLRVPLGLDPDGLPVVLDLREAAEGGDGPHGLVVGATGSGKSELLRALVVGLAMSHAPTELTLVLIDFKGGATFAEVASLPHVAGAITNLADDLALVERAEDVLAGELVRRQELLREAGASSVREARERGAAEASRLPDLLIMVDEFSELLLARPSAADLFAAIGRLGRSLGLHLLLATQRLEEGRLRGLEAHLSYRIALRTFSAQESRTALGVPDAAALPQAPGHGLLRTGPDGLVRFRGLHLGAPAPAAGGRAAPNRALLASFRRGEPATPDGPPSPAAGTPSQLEAELAALSRTGPPARQLWLPPLTSPLPLTTLVGDLVVSPGFGLHSPALRAAGGLRVPIGSVDRPREQCHEPLLVDLTADAGHAAVVGGARSGVSTGLRTLVTALALAATPQELRVLVVSDDDPAGWRLPHVAALAGRDDPAGVRRLIEAAGDLLVERARAARQDSGATDRVLVVVDGWSTLRTEFADLEAPLLDLAARGLGVGVHLLIGAHRWSDLRPGLRDLLGTRIELRLGDPVESLIDRRRADGVPTGRPGRGLTPSGHHLQLALPEHEDGVALASALRDAWCGPPAEPVRTLPDRIERVRVLEDPDTTSAVALGWEERRWAAALWHPAEEPHLLAFGDSGSGRTTLLRTVAAEVARLHEPAAARLLVADPRRTLLGSLPSGHMLEHLADADAVATAARDLALYLRARLPGPGTTAAQLRARSWWSGAEVFLLVDDADLLGAGGAAPLTALAPLLPHARDIGLHVVLARRAAGASRAWGDPVLTALRDLGSPTLLLAGSPEEGPLMGGLRPAPAAPGRARLVHRGDDVRRVQVAWTPPG